MIATTVTAADLEVGQEARRIGVWSKGPWQTVTGVGRTFASSTFFLRDIEFDHETDSYPVDAEFEVRS